MAGTKQSSCMLWASLVTHSAKLRYSANSALRFEMTFSRKANSFNLSIVEAVGFKSEIYSGLNNLAAFKAFTIGKNSIQKLFSKYVIKARLRYAQSAA